MERVQTQCTNEMYESLVRTRLTPLHSGPENHKAFCLQRRIGSNFHNNVNYLLCQTGPTMGYMSNVTWLNRKTGLTTSAAVLTQWQTQLAYTINNNIFIILSILGVFNYLTVKTMYLSKLVKYRCEKIQTVIFTSYLSVKCPETHAKSLKTLVWFQALVRVFRSKPVNIHIWRRTSNETGSL